MQRGGVGQRQRGMMRHDLVEVEVEVEVMLACQCASKVAEW
jgi:hypothetical protein